jgi:cytochrome b561
VLPYLDVVLVLIAAALAGALGAPALGLTVGVAAWVFVRLVSKVAERRIETIAEVRRRLAVGVAFGMARVWALAAAIIIVGLAGTRADGLTTALVVFGAFSIHFGCSAIAHVSRKRSATP